MQINISGQHVEITEALKQYVSEKLERLKNHFNNIISTHVVLTVENKIQQKAEAQINLPGNQIYAEVTEQDMYAAIDKLVDKLDRQIIKYKEKLKNHNNGD